MAYSDFTTLRRVQDEFGIRHKKQPLFESVKSVSASKRLLEDLSEAQLYFNLTTEKAKSELLIMPVLKEIKRKNIGKVNVFSGVELSVSVKNLNGFCDYIIGAIPDVMEINAPLFCIVEAKNRTLEEGFGQCAAEIYAASLYNIEEKQEISQVYGAVTNGFDWAFMCLIDKNLIIDTDRYTVLKLSELLGVFQKIINSVSFAEVA